MKCPQCNNPIDKDKLYLPKRGSGGYWFRIIAFGFVWVFMFTAGPLTIFFFDWNPAYIKYGLIIGLACAIFGTIKLHHKMMTADEKTYVKFFNPPNQTIYQFSHDRDSGSPLDRSSTAYWTMGAGSAGHDDWRTQSRSSSFDD